MKSAGKGGAPALALGAHDLVGGDIYDAEIHIARDHGVVQDLVKYLQIWIASGKDVFFVGLLPGFESLGVLNSGFRLAHSGASLIHRDFNSF